MFYSNADLNDYVYTIDAVYLTVCLYYRRSKGRCHLKTSWLYRNVSNLLLQGDLASRTLVLESKRFYLDVKVNASFAEQRCQQQCCGDEYRCLVVVHNLNLTFHF